MHETSNTCYSNVTLWRTWMSLWYFSNEIRQFRSYTEFVNQPLNFTFGPNRFTRNSINCRKCDFISPVDKQPRDRAVIIYVPRHKRVLDARSNRKRNSLLDARFQGQSSKEKTRVLQRFRKYWFGNIVIISLQNFRTPRNLLKISTYSRSVFLRAKVM